MITMWHVLEHFCTPLEIILQVRELLSERGIIFIEVPNLHSLKFILSKNKWIGGNSPRYHRSFFEPKTMRLCLRNAGMQEITRLRLSYPIPGMNKAYHFCKRPLSLLGLDSFLVYVAMT